MAKSVIVYSAEGCNECNKVKEILKEEHVPFEIRDVLKNPDYQEEVEKHGFMGIPVTVVNGRAVKGYNDELIELIQSAKK